MKNGIIIIQEGYPVRSQNLWLIWGLLFILIFTGCSPANSLKKDPNRVQAYTTLYPLEYFAKRIGGERIHVENLVPVGTDLHDFEPSASDLAKLAAADLFIYNGADLEPWVEKMGNVIDQQKTKMVQATQSISLLSAESEPEHRDEHKDHPHIKNPHVWLDPQLAKKQAAQIKRGLIEVDPKHQSVYEKNYQQLVAELDQLDREFQRAIERRKVNQIVVPHDAFAYLSKRYGLHQITISGLSSMDEPTPQKLKQVVDVIKKHQLKYVFFEPFGDQKLVQIVQKETGVQALMLHPLEGRTKQEVASDEDYFSIMRKNKENLSRALESSS